MVLDGGHWFGNILSEEELFIDLIIELKLVRIGKRLVNAVKQKHFNI